MAEMKSPVEDRAAAAGREPALGARAQAMNPVSHDVVLQIRIVDQLKANTELDTSDLSVVVRNRSATLFGSVPSEAQRALAQRVATEISGIIEVTNRLKTKANKETA